MEQTFERASRLKLRFDTPRGLITVEDLWDLPLTSGVGKPNLDDIAKGLNRDLRASAEETSFVEPSLGTDAVTSMKKLAFEIVKHVINVKVAERAAAADAVKRRENKQKILAIIESKQNEALGAKSLEELQALAASM